MQEIELNSFIFAVIDQWNKLPVAMLNVDDTKVFENSSIFKFYRDFYFILFYFLIGIHSMQGWTANTRHGVTRKEADKRLQDTENLFRKNLQLKDVC